MRSRLAILVAAAWTLLAVFFGLVEVRAAGFDPAREFTILRIDPDPDKERVTLFFSQEVSIRDLQYRLRILPRTAIDWRACRADRTGAVSLAGDFRFAQNYVLSLPPNWTLRGKRYRSTVTRFFMPDSPAKAVFAGPGAVVELNSRQLIHTRLTNVERITLEGFKVPPLLIPLALAAAAPAGPTRPAPPSWAETWEALTKAASEAGTLIAGDKRFARFLTPPAKRRQLFYCGGRKNRPRAFSIPLSFRPASDRGSLELIRLTYLRDNAPVSTRPRLFRITDIGLAYKAWKDGLLIWATSLARAEGRFGLHVLGLTRQLEAFYLGQTEDEGLFSFKGGELEGLSLSRLGRFAKIKRRLHPSEIAFVIVGDDEDVSFIEINGPAALKPLQADSPAAYPPGRADRPAPLGASAEPIKGQVFTDRGVYRPGDEVQFKGVVRILKDRRLVSPAGRGLIFEAISARGERIFFSKAELSEFGTASGAFKLEPYLPLGRYTLKMRYGPAEGQTASAVFQVQEFKPPRHYAQLTFSRRSAIDASVPGREREVELVRVEVKGLYYAGGPVKHGQVRWQIYHTGTEHKVAGFEDYEFGYPAGDKDELLESGEAVLDAEGKLSFDFPLDWRILSGQRGLLISASVIDFDGRASSASKRYQVEPELLVGISKHPPRVQAGQSQALSAIVTDPFGKRIYYGRIQAEVLQESGTYIRKRNQRGDVYWNYETVWRRVFAAELPIKQGKAGFEFDFAWGGRYRLAFTYTDDKGRKFTSATNFEVTGDVMWQAYYRRDRPYQDLALAADKERYRPGDRARIFLMPQRPVTRCLVSLERDEVIKYWVIEPKPGQKYIDVPIEEGHAPNVYLSVLAISPRGEFPVYSGRYDSQAPDFLFGTVNLPVRLGDDGLKVAIGSGSGKLKGRPGRPVSIELSVEDEEGRGRRAELAVGVVDESVLALTGYQVPSLDKLLYFTTPLDVDSGEERVLLLHQTPFSLAKNETLTGGGALAAKLMAPGRQPIKIRGEFNPVAYFNPRVVTDDQGRAEVSFTLPDTMTTYRVYVVACDAGGGFANAARSLLAVQDFYLEPGLPRFLTKGDRFTFKVRAFNNTDRSGQASIEVEAEGGLELTGPAAGIDLEADGSAETSISGRAAATGPAKVTVTGVFGDLTDGVALSLPINSGYVLETEVLFGKFEGSTQVRFPLHETAKALDVADLSPGEARCLVTVAGSPFLRLVPAVKYLLRYPYGCVEQTASQVIGLAALRPFIREGLVPGVSLGKADERLSQGLDRLMSMQTDDGGFGYWPGQWQAHAWGSAYAVLALTLAKQAGLKAPQDRLRRAQDYLKRIVRRGWPDHLQRAVSCYALALDGRLDNQTLQAAARDYNKAGRQARMLLVLAGHEAGLGRPERLRESALRLLERSGPEIRRDEFSARYRQPAVALLLGQAVLPGDPAVDRAAMRLLGGLGRSGAWTSTSDTSWSLYALSKYLAGAKIGLKPVTVTLRQTGRPAVSLELDPKSFRIFPLDVGRFVADPTFEIETDGQGPLLYLVELTLPRPDYSRSGRAAGFKIEKTIKNTDGSEVIRVGDLVTVRLKIEAEAADLRYVVLDDPLPAGLMALNTAFKTEENLPPRGEMDEAAYRGFYWSPDGYYRFVPEFMEIKDDRVLAFRDRLWRGTFEFVYYARAVAAGEFVVPPSRAALMYRPEVKGLSPASRLTIEPAEGGGK